MPRRLSRPVTADTALPVLGVNASTETVALYRWLRWLKGRPEAFWMPSDRHDVITLNSYEGGLDDWRTQTGKTPVGLQLEYHDPNWVTGYTGAAAGPAVPLAEIQRATLLGVKFLALNAHMGNPATGALSRNGQDGTQSGAPGYQYDRNGTPLASVRQSGGAQYSQWTGWLDRFKTWCDACVFPVGHAKAGTRIPILFRLWHECSGSTFWWAGSDRATDFVGAWQEGVAYLKARSPALTNVLFAVCYDTANSGSLTSWSSWYAGDAYVDAVTYTRYDDSATAYLNDAGGMMDAGYSNAVALGAPGGKPLLVTECGYTNDNTANLWDDRVITPLVQRYPLLSGIMTWRPEVGAVKWGPGSSVGADSSARKASAASAARNPNLIAADRCPL